MCGRSGSHATHCRCCSRCRPRPSAPLELGKSASTRPLLHAARIARGDMCMHMWAPRGRLIRFKHILCAWRIHSEILSSGSRRWRRDSIALGKPRAVAQKLGAICSERWVLSSYSHSACGEPDNTTLRIFSVRFRITLPERAYRRSNARPGCQAPPTRLERGSQSAACRAEGSRCLHSS